MDLLKSNVHELQREILPPRFEELDNYSPNPPDEFNAIPLLPPDAFFTRQIESP